jgi:protoheme IX farnesyltransferase
VRGEAGTRRQIWIYTLELVPISLLLLLFKPSGITCLVSAILLGLWMISGAWRVWKKEGNKIAWQMYRWTSMYLLFIFVAFKVDAMV